MFVVYILQSLKRPEKTYVGKTIKPVNVRLSEHNQGKNRSTKPFIPWKIIYYEQFYCELCSEKREVFLKSGVGYRFRKHILKHQIELE